MTRLKRLCIDWFWPDQTTFLTKGRRYAKLYFWGAALLLALGLVPIVGTHYSFTREWDPLMTELIDELESAREQPQAVPARTLKAAAFTVRAFQQFLRDMLFFFYILCFGISSMILNVGIYWLRAHQALSQAIQARPQDRPEANT
ncbi:MAG TPA: hypothetical protein VLD18_01685 [Verrucomicrobiae bacterium]|nr:hypothetical protein [Verrucomicrobiae bacterium]